MDRYGKSAHLSDPSSWNRYTYSRNDPVNNNDPTGFCSVLIGGITQNIYGDPSSQMNFAQDTGAISAFPYQGSNGIVDITSVLAQGLGIPTGATYTALQAIALAAQSSGPISIFTFSGGAQAFTAAWSYLSADVQNRITNITYIDPGAFGSVTGGNGANVHVYEDSSDIANILVQVVTTVPLTATFVDTGVCGHTSECVYNNFADSLKQLASPPCEVGAGSVLGAPAHLTVRPVFSGYVDDGISFEFVEPVPVVTTTITYE